MIHRVISHSLINITKRRFVLCLAPEKVPGDFHAMESGFSALDRAPRAVRHQRRA